MTVVADVRDQVVGLEERFWLEGGGDPDFWRRHFAEDGLVALPFGVMDKAQTVAAMQQARPWARVAMDEIRVLAVGETSVLVTYTATAGREGDADDYRVVIGSLYARQDGSWRLLFHQQSPVTSPTS